MTDTIGIILIAALFAFAGGLVWDIVWRLRIHRGSFTHVCDFRTLYKRVALIDSNGVWLRRCDKCSTETFSTSKWPDRVWHEITIQYREQPTAVVDVYERT